MQVLRLAAVIGQGFPYPVLQAFSPDVPGLDDGLAELKQAELILEKRLAPELEFTFKHALIQEVAYASITLQNRKELHGRVGQAIEGLYRDRLEEFYALLAYHYAEVESWEKAPDYLIKAGDQASRLAADEQALTTYQYAIAIYGWVFGDQWDPVQRATLARKIGEEYTRQGAIDQALKHFHQALTLLGHPFPRARLRLRLAIAGEVVRQVIVRLLPGWPLRGQLVDDPASVDEEILLYENFGWIYSFQDAERFILCPLRELNLSERNKKRFGIVMASFSLGIVLDLMPIFPLATLYHRIALQRVDRVQNPIAKGQLYLGLTFHEFYRGNIGKAIEFYHQSNEFYDRAGDLRLMGQAKVSASAAIFQLGDLSWIAKMGEELIRLGQESNVSQSWCHGLHLRGLALRLQGKIESAIQIQTRVSEMAHKLTNYQFYALARAELVLCYLGSGLLSQALSELKKLQDFRAQDHFLLPHVLARILYSQASAYLTAAEGGSEADRDQWLRDAHRACREMLKLGKSYRAYLTEALLLRGQYEWLRGKTEQARRHWQRSLAEAEALGMRYNLARAHFELGYRLGKREHLEIAAAVFSEIGAEFDDAKAREYLILKIG